MKGEADRNDQVVRSDDDRRPVERELADLKKEVVEARNLVIKTDNLLKNLHAELKNVAKRGDDQFRRTLFSSGVAYLLFVVLAGAVAFFAARSSVTSERARVDAANSEAEQAKQQLQAVTAQLQKVKAEQDLTKGAGDKAFAAFKLMSEGEGEGRLKGVDQLAALDRSRLSPLEQRALDDRARALKVELAQVAFDKGRSAFRRQDMKAAASELRRFLALDPEGSDAPQAAFFLGNALFSERDWEGAVSALEKVAVKSRGLKNGDWAMLLLGQAHEQLGHYERAAEVYRKALTDFPASEFTGQLQQRLRMAQRGASSSGQSAPTPGAAPAVGQPAPTLGAAPSASPAAVAPAGAALAPAAQPSRPQ